MNEHAYFHWDLLRQPLQTPQFGMGAPFFDVNSILELRKEKSRDAARSRRGKENYEFYELAKLLPLPAAITSQLDKASIIRLTISYLKLRDFSCHGDPQWTQEGGPVHGKLNKGQSSRLDLVDPFESRQGTHILQSLDGFAFILANDGRFLYISETVSIYLGLSQVEMAGSSIFEYVHPQDHTELAEHLGMCVVTVGPSGNSPTSGSEDSSSPTTPRPSSPSEKGYMMVHKPDKSANKSFSLRMKSTLTKRGVHVKTSGYRVVHILGTLRPQSAYGASRSGAQVNGTGNGTGAKSNNPEAPLLGLVGMAIALPPPTITELRLELDTFITRLSPDFKVIYCEPIISDLMDLAVEDFTDRLLYDLCHVADLKSLKRSHEDILTKGQALTDYYRVMNRHGGYVWVQTCATTLLNNKNAEDQSILAINYVVSGIENKTSACDLWQVTGDVSSAMSSSSKSRCREEKLKELKSSKLLLPPANKNLATNLSPPASSTPSLSPSNISKTDNKNDDVKHKSGVKNSTTTEKSPKTQPRSPTEDGDNLSPGKSGDGKNKRRKMENPRKRKRSNSDAPEQDDTALNLTRGPLHNSVGAEADKQSRCGSGEVTAGERKGPVMPPLILHPDLVTSSSPEDLSMKKMTNIPLDRRIIQHSPNVYTGVTSPTREKKKCVADNLESQSSSSPISSITGNSVQELEAAMNRHLPSNTSILDSLSNDGHPFNGSLTTSSTMPKSFSCLQPGISTTAASSTSHWLTAQKPTGSDVLTASNFLRSLYANRESVIKTSSRSQTHFLNPEPPTSLLTPPEPDPTTYKDPHHPYSYGKSDPANHGHIYDKNPAFEAKDHLYRDQNPKDQFSFISYKDHIPSSYIDHISSSMYKDHLSTTYKDHLTSTYKDLSPYRDIIPAFTIPSLMSPTGRMHQAYPSLPHHFSLPMNPATMDACSITPPSSNSPEVGKQLPAPQQYDASSGYSSDMSGTCNLSQKQTMLANPLPPSVASLPSASPTTHSGHYHAHTQRHGKEQLYHGGDVARGGYYGITPQTAGSMYMDLNQSSTGQYETCNRPVLPWY